MPTSLRAASRLLFCASVTTGCGVRPPSYQAGVAHGYCAALLESARWFVNVDTPLYLVFACLTVGLGYLTSQFSNDPQGPNLLAKHRASLVFVLALVSGILGVYFRSRADAASRAAADIQVAMIAPGERTRYDMCLEASLEKRGIVSDERVL